jgi:hypothetical protein
LVLLLALSLSLSLNWLCTHVYKPAIIATISYIYFMYMGVTRVKHKLLRGDTRTRVIPRDHVELCGDITRIVLLDAEWLPVTCLTCLIGHCIALSFTAVLVRGSGRSSHVTVVIRRITIIGSVAAVLLGSVIAIIGRRVVIAIIVRARCSVGCPL